LWFETAGEPDRAPSGRLVHHHRQVYGSGHLHRVRPQHRNVPRPIVSLYPQGIDTSLFRP